MSTFIQQLAPKGIVQPFTCFVPEQGDIIRPAQPRAPFVWVGVARGTSLSFYSARHRSAPTAVRRMLGSGLGISLLRAFLTSTRRYDSYSVNVFNTVFPPADAGETNASTTARSAFIVYAGWSPHHHAANEPFWLQGTRISMPTSSVMFVPRKDIRPMAPLRATAFDEVIFTKRRHSSGGGNRCELQSSACV